MKSNTAWVSCMGLTTEDYKMITIKVHGDQIVDAGQNLHIHDDEEIYMTM